MLEYSLVGLFSVTVLTVWSPVKILKVELWKLLGFFTMVFALMAKFIDPIAIIWIMIPFTMFSFEQNLKNNYLVFAIRCALFIYLLAMGLRFFPGFHNFTLVAPEKLGNSTMSFGLNYTLAKPTAGLLVFGFIAQRVKSFSELKNILFERSALLNWLIPAVLLIITGVIIGLRLDIKWQPWFPLFFLTNLTFTVIQEEAFFRSFIQQPLQTKYGKKWWIIPISAIPFALIHTPHPGANLAGFYTVLLVAGMLYAWSYFKTSRLESVLATHLAVNIFHIIFLTYPLAP